MRNKTEYREIIQLNPVLLYKSDILELEKLLVEDSETEAIEIIFNYNSITIYVESFNELLERSDIPYCTDRVYIDMKKWIETEDRYEISSGVTMSFNHNHVNCQIHSIDQTWFMGKKSQIQNYCVAKKPWYSFINKAYPFLPTIILALLFYSGYFFAHGQFFQMLLPATCSILLIVLTVLIFQGKLFPFVKICLHEKPTISLGFYEICALIGALSGLATLIQLFSKIFK